MSTDPIGMDEQPPSSKPERNEIVRLVRENNVPGLSAYLSEFALPLAVDSFMAQLSPRCPTCKRGATRWAMTTAFKIAKLLQLEPQILVQILARFGVENEAELQAMVTVSRSIDSMPVEEKVRRCKLYLAGVYEKRPDLREATHSPEELNGSSAKEVSE